MLPNLAIQYLGNDSEMNAVFFRKFPLQESFCGSNGDDIGLCEFGQMLSRPTREIVSAFGNTVGDVFGCSPEEKVLWVDARRIIAMVTNIFVVWRRTAEFSIRNAVRAAHLSIIPNGAVAACYRAACPIPAVGYRVNGNLRKQPLFDRFWHERNLP